MIQLLQALSFDSSLHSRATLCCGSDLSLFPGPRVLFGEGRRHDEDDGEARLHVSRLLRGYVIILGRVLPPLSAALRWLLGYRAFGATGARASTMAFVYTRGAQQLNAKVRVRARARPGRLKGPRCGCTLWRVTPGASAAQRCGLGMH